MVDAGARLDSFNVPDSMFPTPVNFTFIAAIGVPRLDVICFAAYLVIVLMLVVYGLHRYWLVYLYSRHARGTVTPNRPTTKDIARLWPRVTVQLPMYNERAVAQRVIDAACGLDYPQDRFEVQILDDSTDATRAITDQACARWRDRGIDIHVVCRGDRQGYKAGALQNGLATATGEFIAVFDADFVPPASLLKRAMAHFRSDRIGMVQTRWTHLNRRRSPLTRSQAVFLDGHFVVEHTARNRSGRWINFNGTAGIWRRTCIEDAGGWQDDTLTEDVDLSYRAQTRGWQFVYDPTIECPGELPPSICAFMTQQHRWTKGSIQTAVKLLPSIAQSRAPIANKIEAWFHLTCPAVSVLIVLLTILLLPAMSFRGIAGSSLVLGALTSGLTLFALATVSAGAFYVLSQREQGRGWLASLAELPGVMALGIGVSANNARGVVEAIAGLDSEFVRTPKFGALSVDAVGALPRRRVGLGSSGAIELTLGMFSLACIVFALPTATGWLSVPFLLLFACGYLSVGIGSLAESLRAEPVSGMDTDGAHPTSR